MKDVFFQYLNIQQGRHKTAGFEEAFEIFQEIAQ